MSGYEGTHQDWLEDRASHELEREAFEDERRLRARTAGPRPFREHGPAWIMSVTDDGIYLSCGGLQALSFDEAVQLANAILSEVEIAQRGDTDEGQGSLG